MTKALFLAVTLLAACATLEAQDASLKRLMQKKSDESVAAFKAKNVAWFEKNSTDDLTDVENGKTYNKATAMQQMKQMFAAMSPTDVSEKILAMKMSGKNVVLTSKTHFAGTIKSPSNSPQKLDITSTGEEVWAPVGGDYKLKSMKVISENVLLNGKPVKAGM